jgi:hypothetical protein
MQNVLLELHGRLLPKGLTAQAAAGMTRPRQINFKVSASINL